LKLAQKLERELPGIEALVVDDTGFPKQGTHSVGVQRQYSGTLGRVGNCQVATSLHLAGEAGSACIGLRLYLPEAWTQDLARRRKAGIPDDIEFRTKWQIAVQLVDDALAWGVRKHVVLADAGCGDAVEFREALSERGLAYAVGVTGTHMVWPPGAEPHLPEHPAGQPGRPRTRFVDGHHAPMTIADLAQSLRQSAFRKVTWREGSRGKMSSRFACVRVRSAEGHVKGRPPSEEQWLVCEWPVGEASPTKFYLSTLPPDISHRELVRTIKLRWRVERDYQDLKQEVGLDHYEGRTWRGFHHHATLCSIAHAFLAIRRALFPPEPSALDPADGQTRTASHSRPSHWNLSSLQATNHAYVTGARPVENLENAIR
jgi:SRSO17 transposase